MRDMPRLFVDIDLTCLPIEDRTTSLASISTMLETIASTIPNSVHGAKVQLQKDGITQRTKALNVRHEGIAIKVEANQVIRGSVFACQEPDLCPSSPSLL